MDLGQHTFLHVQQIHEAAELFGFETRNKFKILDGNKNELGFAAEKKQGIALAILRQYLGHWRTFDFYFYDNQKQPIMVAHHPFRFYFECLEVQLIDKTKIGSVHKKFSLFYKKFEFQDPRGAVLFTMKSPFWKIWTFPIFRREYQIACITKKWSGLLSEAYTDKDNFIIEFSRASLSDDHRRLVLAAALLVDLQYFEKKAS